MCRRERKQRETKHIPYMHIKKERKRCITLLIIYIYIYNLFRCFNNKTKKCILLTKKKQKRATCSKEKLKQKEKSHKKKRHVQIK
jgi:hypothetical protein